MIKLVYYVDEEAHDREIDWLRAQSIFAASHNSGNGTRKVIIGVIVTPESALAIKLRHQIAHQSEYTRG
jgi:poly-beta-hydroxyalkanoate depolymerase